MPSTVLDISDSKIDLRGSQASWAAGGQTGNYNRIQNDTWLNKGTEHCRKTCASWSVSQLFLFICSPDVEDSSDSVLGPLFSLTYILPLGDLIQSQSFEQLYIGYYFSVSPLPRAPSAYLTTSTWRIKEVSQAYVHIVTLGLCLPTKSHPPKAFTICPVVLEKHQGDSLDSCFSFPLHIQVLLISSPKTSGPVLCLHVCCKNLASIPIISCLHYHNCLPLSPLPIHFPRCSLNDLFKPPLV